MSGTSNAMYRRFDTHVEVSIDGKHVGVVAQTLHQDGVVMIAIIPIATRASATHHRADRGGMQPHSATVVLVVHDPQPI